MSGKLNGHTVELSWEASRRRRYTEQAAYNLGRDPYINEDYNCRGKVDGHELSKVDASELVRKYSVYASDTEGVDREAKILSRAVSDQKRRKLYEEEDLRQAELLEENAGVMEELFAPFEKKAAEPKAGKDVE